MISLSAARVFALVRWPTSLKRKSPPANRRAFGERGRGDESDRFRELGIELDRVRVISFDALHLMTAAQHAIEFVDQERDRFVAFVRLDHSIHVGALNDHVAFGFEASGDRFLRIALQLDAETHDALLVTKQALRFLADKRFERRCQIEMNAGDDDFAMILAVHVSADGLG